jgi:hypothetical protein
LRDVGVLTGEEFRRAISNTSLDLELILFLFTETGDDVLSVRSSLGIIPVILANKSVVKVVDDVLLLKVLNCAPSDFDLLMVNSFSVDVAWLKTLSVHFNKFGQPFSFNYIIVAKSVEIDLFNGVVEVGVDCLHKDVVRRARIQIGYFNFLQRGSGESILEYTTEVELEPSTQYVFHVIARDKHGHKSVEVSNAVDGYTQPDLTTVAQTESDVNNVHIKFGDDPTTMNQDVEVRGEFVDVLSGVRKEFARTALQEIKVADLNSCSSYNVFVQTINPDFDHPIEQIDFARLSNNDVVEAERLSKLVEMHTQCLKPSNIDAKAVDHEQIKVTWRAIENLQ